MKPSRLRHWVYVVEWPDQCIFKVGYTGRRDRYERIAARGGEVRLVAEYCSVQEALRVEHELHVRAFHICGRAFSAKVEASTILGSGGAGWTECYKGSPTDLAKGWPIGGLMGSPIAQTVTPGWLPDSTSTGTGTGTVLCAYVPAHRSKTSPCKQQSVTRGLDACEDDR